jgi:hypothetical protein
MINNAFYLKALEEHNQPNLALEEFRDLVKLTKYVQNCSDIIVLNKVLITWLLSLSSSDLLLPATAVSLCNLSAVCGSNWFDLFPFACFFAHRPFITSETQKPNIQTLNS